MLFRKSAGGRRCGSIRVILLATPTVRGLCKYLDPQGLHRGPAALEGLRLPRFEGPPYAQHAVSDMMTGVWRTSLVLIYMMKLLSSAILVIRVASSSIA